jgi:hypothetical protein
MMEQKTKEIKTTVVDMSELAHDDFKHPSKYYKTRSWLEIVSKNYDKNTRKTTYSCKCACDKIFTVRSDYFNKLTEGRTKSELCIKCFQDFKKLPDNNFKWIPSTTYAVSRSGEIWSARWDRFLISASDSNGYQVVKLGKTSSTLKVHRLVAEAFIENPENKPCVNHLNGIKNDNRVINLEWTTYSENSQHAHDSGFCRNGEQHPKCKIMTEGVLDIQNSTESTAALSEKYGVCVSTVRRIKRGDIRKNG